MTHEQEQLLREQVHRLLDIALDTNGLEMRSRDRTGMQPTVFFEYMGHINKFRISICPNGWVSMQPSTTLLECNLDRPLQESLILEVENECKLALEDKTTVDALAKEIMDATVELNRKAEELAQLKNRLEELRKKERSRTDA